NRGPDSAPLHLLPTVWFRNTWSWGYDVIKPRMDAAESIAHAIISLHSGADPKHLLYCEGLPPLLFTENETNNERLFGVVNRTPYVKDGINNFVVRGERGAINPARIGTKAAAYYQLHLAPEESVTVRLRLKAISPAPSGEIVYDHLHAEIFDDKFEEIFAARLREADEFYENVIPDDITRDAKNVMRQSLAGLLWSKQYYHYVVEQWLDGDSCCPPPPPERLAGRNHDWRHLHNSDVISMPDKWEYPWYASWDLAFHCLPLALVDPDFAKEQLILFLREWYMHPNGEIPAYEWALGDVNPPVHAWAAWRIYTIDRRLSGQGDVAFLERVFHKLLLNFTWWVNRKDANDNNVFEGGFLGLDNIGLFDRNFPLPDGSYVEQSDGTSWMGMFCLDMLTIALELARFNPVYEDVASKFVEHFAYIAGAMNHMGDEGIELWDEKDGFYYDALERNGGQHFRLKVRSMVGLIPLFAVMTFEDSLTDRFPGFARRMRWFIENRPELALNFSSTETSASGTRRLISIVSPDRLRRILRIMLDENEFLSPHGVRALSRYHRDHQYSLVLDHQTYSISYDPGESRTSVFGGNSNWRGPVWFPVNYLLIEALQRFHHYLGDDFKVEMPTGSGRMLTLWEVATELSHRLINIFLRDANNTRPVFGPDRHFQSEPEWRDLILFYEYFHGDDGRGLGASHQTGWTGL
ncbi:MAG TPA: hypothetical protein VM870_01225, partial [Pyrinomonadaceae bacterium]|nr:hypothetical protein [Pyrinomonadaceae bacterium]